MEKISRRQKNMQNYPVCNELSSVTNDTAHGKVNSIARAPDKDPDKCLHNFYNVQRLDCICVLFYFRCFDMKMTKYMYACLETGYSIKCVIAA